MFAGCHSVEKMPSQMVKNWVLHNDKIPCQTALAVQQILVKKQTAANLQLPYPPDLTPCDFCHFLRPKTGLNGYYFTSAEKIQQNTSAFREPYQKITSRDTFSNSRTAGASCTCRRITLPGWMSYILYKTILVWIMTTFKELSNLPTQHIPARAYKQ